MRGLAIGAACLLSVGCQSESLSVPAPKPTSYAINSDDLWRDIPTDICRRANSEFLNDLMERVKQALPHEFLASFKFRDFNVSEELSRGHEAVLRFTVDREGDAGVLMYAAGVINPRDCTIAELRSGVGASPYMNPEQAEIRIP